MNKRLLLSIAILFALFLTNPDRDDFGRYMERRLERESGLEAGGEGAENGFGRWLGELVTDGLAKVLAKSAERRDFLLFSTYHIGGQMDLEIGQKEGGLDLSLDDEERYLGLLGTFFPY